MLSKCSSTLNQTGSQIKKGSRYITEALRSENRGCFNVEPLSWLNCNKVNFSVILKFLSPRKLRICINPNETCTLYDIVNYLMLNISHKCILCFCAVVLMYDCNLLRRNLKKRSFGFCLSASSQPSSTCSSAFHPHSDVVDSFLFDCECCWPMQPFL